MRLPKLETGQRWPQKLILDLASLAFFSETMDVVRVFMYRPEFFGNAFCDLAHVILRGPSDWSVGERELFGAFTSSLNRCAF
jgi:hypothetical protein